MQTFTPGSLLSRGELVEPCKRRGVCPSCGAKRAVKFAEHIYSNVIEEVPHRHTVFTIPKRLRSYFMYNRSLNSILFRAAWGALSEVLGVDERELAAISLLLLKQRQSRPTTEENSPKVLGPPA